MIRPLDVDDTRERSPLILERWLSGNRMQPEKNTSEKLGRDVHGEKNATCLPLSFEYITWPCLRH